MATTGTYSYSNSVGGLVVAAYRRIGIHRSELLTEHFADAATEANLLQAQWGNLGPLLWTVDLQTVVLVEGQAVYTVPADTVMMLDVYCSTPNGDGTNSDRIITALSRTEYASMPNKTGQGSPTSFWFDRLIAPTVTLWPVPDGTSDVSFSYYRFTQIQDAATANATTAQVPYLALDAYTAGLAHRLARIYKNELEAVREADAVKAFNVFFTQYAENVPLFVQPQTDGYWRN
jgi:hypothetical protein